MQLLIELAYCLKGNYQINIDNKIYQMEEGSFAIIGSMISHEIICDDSLKSKVLVIELGPIMMENYFSMLSKTNFPNPIINLSESSKHKELYSLLWETIGLLESFTTFAELSIKGNLYKIFSCLLRDFAQENDSTDFSKKLRFVSLTETAMEYIRMHYNENIKIETVANICGYSKSNFCKTFKQLLNQTFHSTLNDYRINIACVFLTETNAIDVDQLMRERKATTKIIAESQKQMEDVYKKQLENLPLMDSQCPY